MDGKNGRVFSTSTELAGQMLDLLGGDTGSVQSGDGTTRATGELERLRQGIRGMTRWRENWDESAQDIIIGACPQRKLISREGGGGEGGPRNNSQKSDDQEWDPPLGLKLGIFFTFFSLFYGLTKHFML